MPIEGDVKDMRKLKIFNNFKTKKQLREEIERLKSSPIDLKVIKNEFQEISSKAIIEGFTDGFIPIEVIKKEIIDRMSRFLEPFIKWNIEDDDITGVRWLRGSLYVSSKKKD